MKDATFSNPRYSTSNSKEHFLLDAIYKGEKIEFYASPTDVMEYGRDICARTKNGEFGTIGPYIPPPKEEVKIHPLIERLNALEAEIAELKKAKE
jgi:hypothetical protein